MPCCPYHDSKPLGILVCQIVTLRLGGPGARIVRWRAGRLFLAGLLDALGAGVEGALALADLAGEFVTGLLVCW